MKHSLLVMLLFLVNIQLFGQTDYCSKFNNETIIKKHYITISYSNTNKTPNYVGYCVTHEDLEGTLSRDPSFYSDTSIPKTYRTTSTNYTNSGYDKGHMSPAADWKGNRIAMHESFSMANVCPQKATLNRTYWKMLETHERELAEQCDTLFVITGSISNDETYIKNKIKVPTHFYKTCVGTKNGKVLFNYAWIYQNIGKKQTMANCQTTIKEIEKLIKKDLYSHFWFNKKVSN